MPKPAMPPREQKKSNLPSVIMTLAMVMGALMLGSSLAFIILSLERLK